MNTFIAGITGATLVALAGFTGVSHLFNFDPDSNNHGDSKPGLTLDWQSQVQPGKCTPPVVRHGDDWKGSMPIINVEERVKNDSDSGVAGNYWAFDRFSRRIRVWRTATSTYCALVTYEGSFQGVAGQIAPAGTSTLTGNEKGHFDGGYRATITGTLLPHPLWPTKGSVGEVDYRCDISGNCPGYVNWTTQYFSASVNQNLDWWGWIYRGGQFGTWINAVSGNQGNIISQVFSEPGNNNDKDNSNPQAAND